MTSPDYRGCGVTSKLDRYMQRERRRKGEQKELTRSIKRWKKQMEAADRRDKDMVYDPTKLRKRKKVWF